MENDHEIPNKTRGLHTQDSLKRIHELSCRGPHSQSISGVPSLNVRLFVCTRIHVHSAGSESQAIPTPLSIELHTIFIS